MKLRTFFKFLLFFAYISVFSHAWQVRAAGDSFVWLRKILAEHECGDAQCKAKSLSFQETDDTLFVDYLEKMFTPEQFAHILRVGPEDFIGQGIRQIMVGYVVSELDIIFNTVITVDSKIEVFNINISALDPVLSFVAVIDSKIDNINCSGGNINTLLSLTDLTLSTVDVINSKIDNINCSGGAVGSIDSKTDILIELSDTILSTVMYDFASTWTILEAIEDAIGCLAGNTITQQDVGTTGFVINAPGEYTLCENILFAPSSSLPAITIATNNVTLNLSNKTIQQTNGTAGVSGVIVDINLDGIVIHSGSVTAMTDNGISILSGGSNVIIDGVGFENCGAAGLNVVGANNLVVKNSLFTGNGANGLLVSASNQVCILSSVANDNGADGFGLTGAGSGNLIDTCKAFNNTGHGFNLTGISDGVIRNSIALDNSSDGISLFNCFAIEVSANSSSRNTVNGIDLQGNVGTSECYISNNTMIQNGGVNLIEQTLSGLNSILGNFAQNPTFAGNYCSALSAITTVTIRQSVPFVSSPARWDNINMIP